MLGTGYDRAFQTGPGKFTCVFVLIDKFSKWIEYMPLVQASSEKAITFLDQVIHRFGIPNSIITDLGTQLPGMLFGTSTMKGA